MQSRLTPEVAEARAGGRPVVALESTVIAHGLPWPDNLEVARAVEQAVRAAGAVPATVAVIAGRPAVGLTDTELETLARDRSADKASRRDLAAAVFRGRTAATTVAGTMWLAHRAGIRVFATGGIGGAHRDTGQPWDISADLFELGRVPVAVVCAGAKSILDLPRTLEILETYGVPVLGFGTDTFPAFYLPSSGEPVTCRVDVEPEAAAFLAAHWALGGAGVVVAQPVPAAVALAEQDLATALATAEGEAVREGIKGKALTPFLLSRLATLTGGTSLTANRALLVENARLAARLAVALARVTPDRV